MSFAARWERNKRGWIKFPPDANLRKQIFTEEVMSHPAKANLFMLQSIIDYIPYKPGEVILDPMAGTGSIMIAALSGCRVVCIDTSPLYAKLLNTSREAILAHKPDADITVLEGDCFDYLPLPVDHICFSPPYVQIMAKTHISEKDISTAERYVVTSSRESLLGYSEGKGNLGMMSEFFHMQRMEQIFAKCLSSLPPHGTMTLITKDHIEAGRRIHLTRKYIKAAERAGFKLIDAFKMEARGTGFVDIHSKKGIPMVRDEDIWICRRK